MVRAIIFDLDGVIRIWDADLLPTVEKRHGLPPGAFHAAAFESSLAERAVCGHIEDEAWRAAVQDTLVRAHGQTAVAAVQDWCRLTGRVHAEMLSLAVELRARMRTGLLTNATTRLEADLRLLDLDGCFDAVVSSARLGFAKPDPRIYRVAAERLGCRPEECIFIDDTPGHVEAARALGVTGFVFAGVTDLKAQLEPLIGTA